MAPRRHDAMGALAGELVGLNVDVIMAYGDEAIVAAMKATASMPGSVTRLSALSFASTAS